jgi:penicillin-binding protein 2
VTVYGTAAASHLEGIDFIGKTGTAQVMSHDALSRSGGGHKTVPNSWFVGMAPRRNPDIVVAMLWENGDQGASSARWVAQVINAFVTKQRRHDNNIRIADTPQTTPSEPTTVKPTTPTAE